MAGEVVPAGPFVGGLNTQGDEGSIADNEATVLQNFEVDIDGSLRSRAPFVSRGYALPVAGWRLLGFWTDTNGVIYPVGSGSSGTYYFAGSAWVRIATFQAAAVIQFQGRLYLFSGTAAGGAWDGTTYTADGTTPLGTSAVVLKGRIFVGTKTGLRYSSVIVDGNFWSSGPAYGGTVTIGGLDGQSTVRVIVAYGNVLIFRTRSIWSFSYSTDPTYGDQSQLVAGIGLDSVDALEFFEQIIYFMYNGAAYTLNGANASQLNPTVPFVSSIRSGVLQPYSVSVANRKVIFSFYDVMYVFNLRSRTWSTWTTPQYTGIGKILQYAGSTVGDATTYITFSSYGTGTDTIFYTDAYTTEAEATGYDCILRTKTYDYATPGNFKRIFWWGADMLARVPVVGTLMPVAYTASVTWATVRTLTWGQLLSRTWGHPLIASYDQVNTVNTGAAARVFLRFTRALRFRRIRYQLKVTSNGSSSQAPNKVFGIETVVAVKQLVPRQVS